MSYRDSNLRGVGGWLSFLVVVLLILSPLRLVFGALLEISSAESANPSLTNLDSWSTFKLAVWICTVFSAGIFAFAGWRLNTRFEPSSVKLAIIAMWLGAPLMTVLGLMMGGAILGGNLFEEGAIFEVVKSGIWAGVWTAYLKISKRVYNTYIAEYDSNFFQEEEKEVSLQ